MGTLYLVRHGQASFGAADYDQLSPLGQRQCVRLGGWFRERGTRFDAVLTGTLRRHAQSLAAIEEGLQAQHAALALPGLNEYDGDALVAAQRSYAGAGGNTELLRIYNLLGDPALVMRAPTPAPQVPGTPSGE